VRGFVVLGAFLADTLAFTLSIFLFRFRLVSFAFAWWGYKACVGVDFDRVVGVCICIVFVYLRSTELQSSLCWWFLRLVCWVSMVGGRG
jgi:hypothetical protein